MSPQQPSLSRNLEDFVRIASDWFWETDADHRFCFFTEQLEDIVGIDRKRLLGRSRLDLATDATASDRWKTHADDLTHHRPFHNFEYHVRQDDGHIVWVRVSGEPIFDDSGAFQGYRGCGHNITSEKLAVARLEASNAALQMRNQQLDAARVALERSAYEDTLTEVWNRRAFERDLKDLLACEDRNIGLLHIDLDKFKWINDTLGHQTGDTVLQVAAKRIGQTAGALGTSYRVGGDEFMIILCDHVTESVAVRLGHQITNAVSAPISVGRSKVTIGASVGIAISKHGALSSSDLIRQADAALYEAKARGRNAICALSDRLLQRLETHRWTAADLGAALSDDQLVPYFQPQMDLATQTIIGAEVLVRWHHPTRGMIAPDDFLPVAAELALINQIDQLMLKKGLAVVDRLSAQGLHVPSLSINTSQARLMDPRLVSDVGCFWDPAQCSLSLELLETIYLDDCCDGIQLHQTIARLRAMGVRIEIDDFGSARASITGLLKVQPDRLKIDRHLVQAVESNPDKRNIVRAIVELAQSMKIACLAEGAEDQGALDALWDMGCAQVQGYAVAPPLSEAELVSFLRQRHVTVLGDRSAPKPRTAGPMDLPRTAEAIIRN
ncbi:MAG: EAL domain-containing protein [Pseudomonadota bacterium]